MIWVLETHIFESDQSELQSVVPTLYVVKVCGNCILNAKKSKKQFKQPISLFSLCAEESSLLKRPIFDGNSRNANAFFSMFPTNMTWTGYTMRKLASWAFRKCGSFLVLKVLSQSYWLSKSGENWRKNSLERRCPKKRHGHNIDFWGLKRIGRSTNMVGRSCYSFQTSKLKIVVVSFFWTPLIFGDGPVFSDSSIFDGL